MSGALTATATFASTGPLFTAAAAIVARLAEVFPPAKFQHGWLPLAPDKNEWQRLVNRTPYVGLTWTGVEVDPNSGAMLRGRATFRLVLVTANPHVPGRVLGDKLGPGQFGLAQVAALALHSLRIGGDDVVGAGSVSVSDIANLSTEGFADAAQAVTGMTLSAPFGLTGDVDLLPDLLRLRGGWEFDGQLMPAAPERTDLPGAS